jgi:ferritin-like metal-binding protein YciE
VHDFAAREQCTFFARDWCDSRCEVLHQTHEESLSRQMRRHPLNAGAHFPMKLFSANLTSLSELYTVNLQKALDMEETITKALPKMIEKAYHPALKQAFETHLQETQMHVEKVKNLLGPEADSKTCKVIHALVSEAEDTMKDVTDSAIIDIAMIGVAQQVEHHEVAVYGTLKAWALILGLSEDYDVLESIEADELNADQLLTDISDSVNVEGARITEGAFAA